MPFPLCLVLLPQSPHHLCVPPLDCPFTLSLSQPRSVGFVVGLLLILFSYGDASCPLTPPSAWHLPPAWPPNSCARLIHKRDTENLDDALLQFLVTSKSVLSLTCHAHGGGSHRRAWSGGVGGSSWMGPNPPSYPSRTPIRFANSYFMRPHCMAPGTVQHARHCPGACGMVYYTATGLHPLSMYTSCLWCVLWSVGSETVIDGTFRPTSITRP